MGRIDLSGFQWSSIHWVDFAILLFFIFSAGCLTLIHIRKTIKYGYLRAFLQPIDDFDRTLVKASGVLFTIFIALITYKLYLKP